MPIVVLNGPTIPAGESLSDVIDCTAGPPVRITMPAGWTAANLTFQISSDNQFFNDLYDAQGREVRVAVVPGVGMRVPLEWSRSAAYLKFRSGTRARPIAQEAERLFAVAIETPAA